MSSWLYPLLGVSCVSLLSLMGVIAIPVRRETLDKVVFYLVSLATGAMLGNAVVHLMPEAFEHASPMLASILILAGFLASFMLEKVLNLRCHHTTGGHCKDEHDDVPCACKEAAAHKHEDEHEHDHDHHDDDEEGHGHNHSLAQHFTRTPAGHIHVTGWMSLVSHAMDNFMDGVLIAVSFMVSVPTGLATTLAIVLHEIPMEFGGFGVLVNAGFSRWGAIAVNFSSAIVATIGTILTLWLGGSIPGLSAYLTPACAGIVLYIVCSGLVPQLQKETNPRRSLVQIGIMVLGITAMILVKFLE